jgi:hypothetical protein
VILENEAGFFHDEDLIILIVGGVSAAVDDDIPFVGFKFRGNSFCMAIFSIEKSNLLKV